MASKEKVNIFWHRRDLRFFDNAGLFQALKNGHPVLSLFIFDKNILDDLEDKRDLRVNFIYNTLIEMKSTLEKEGSSLMVKYGYPEQVWPHLIKEYPINAVFTNRDYEPYAKKRDSEVTQLLQEHNIPFHTYKDQIIFENHEVVKEDGNPYVVFTPYSRKWKAKLLENTSSLDTLSHHLDSFPSQEYLNSFIKCAPLSMPKLSDLGFEASTIPIPENTVTRGLIRKYSETRDFPAIKGTSRLGVHFRFGTISIRQKVRDAIPLNETFLNELIWRDFYSQILAHFPRVVKESFRPEYDHIDWENDPELFQKWCDGQTGYPIVDAGMRELNQTGYMHNRVRMVTASFLTKHLLIDWRWGEAYFAKKLLDFDLASNNGGWQWAAGCGTDAAPYFRIFNPESQQKKFDEKFEYIKKWIPEFGTDTYPAPIIDHKYARQRCLERYKTGIEKGRQLLKK